MKPIEELTFNELVEWAEIELWKALIKGEVHVAMWSICQTVARWRLAMNEKEGS